MNKIIYLLVFAIPLFSCKESKRSYANNSDVSEMTDIVLSNDNKMYLHEWVQDVEIIPLETSDSVLFGVISGCMVTDEHIIVFDTYQAQSVFIFGRDGKHQMTINKYGRGPQEYLHLTHVAMLPDKKTIAIHDNHGRKILYYSLDGQFIYSDPTPFSFYNMEFVDDNNLVFSIYYSTRALPPELEKYGMRHELLYFTDNKYEIKSSAMPMRYDMNKFGIFMPTIQKYVNKVYINRPFSDTIYLATQDGLKPIYRINMEKIGGVANFAPDITREEVDLLKMKKSTFSGLCADTNDFLHVCVKTPPDLMIHYVYSKRSGKVYMIEHDLERTENFIFGPPIVPITATKDKIVLVKYAETLFKDGVKDLVKMHPEFASFTENDNPVLVLYSYRKDL